MTTARCLPIALSGLLALLPACGGGGGGSSGAGWPVRSRCPSPPPPRCSRSRPTSGRSRTGLYLTFDEFRQALGQALAGGASVRQITAFGPYDAPTSTVSALLATAVLR